MKVGAISSGLIRLIAEITAKLLVVASFISLGLYWGKLFEALLVLVTILQFELAYRQRWFDEVRDEPAFTVRASKIHDSVLVAIKNIGPTPAYLVGVSRVICGGAPLSPDKWVNYIKRSRHGCLAPSSSDILAFISMEFYDRYLREGNCVLEVSYINKYGEFRSFGVMFQELTPITVTHVSKPPGFLLSLADDIAMLRAYIGIRKLKQKLSSEEDETSRV